MSRLELTTPTERVVEEDNISSPLFSIQRSQDFISENEKKSAVKVSA